MNSIQNGRDVVMARTNAERILRLTPPEVSVTDLGLILAVYQDDRLRVGTDRGDLQLRPAHQR